MQISVSPALPNSKEIILLSFASVLAMKNEKAYIQQTVTKLGAHVEKRLQLL